MDASWDSYRGKEIKKLALSCKGLVLEPVHQKQPNNKTCVHTCLAMVSGLPVEKVIEAYGDHRGLTWWDEQTFLGLCGIRYHPINFREILPLGGVYLATIQSLNHKNTAHRIVMVKQPKSKTIILDPNEGVEGKIAYTMKETGGHRMFDLLFLEPGNFYVPNMEG
tara:strand:+ start:2559 stop:3053 length:495 start_codon:yes stop_codon:yes gene_type:complete